MYNKFGRNFSHVFPNIFLSSMRNVAPQFTSRDYMSKRNLIESTIHQALYDKVSGRYNLLRLLNLLEWVVKIPYLGTLQCANLYSQQELIFTVTPVCHSVHGGGVCIPACIGADTPLGRHPPPTPTPRRRLLQQRVRILLECILVFK